MSEFARNVWECQSKSIVLLIHWFETTNFGEQLYAQAFEYLNLCVYTNKSKYIILLSATHYAKYGVNSLYIQLDIKYTWASNSTQSKYR